MRRLLIPTAALAAAILIAPGVGSAQPNLGDRDRKDFCFVLGDWCLPFPEPLPDWLDSALSAFAGDSRDRARIGDGVERTDSATTRLNTDVVRDGRSTHSGEAICGFPADRLLPTHRDRRDSAQGCD